MTSWSVCMVVCLLIAIAVVSGQSVEVNTPYGALRGSRTTIGPDSYVDSFHNIPYAHPPVGSLRFQKPQPPQKWSGVREASRPGTQCPQRARDLPPSRLFHNDEDCLYLNVYRPKVSSNDSRLPVMVWIHGGSYYVSTGNYYDGRQVASKGVVVVTINYRLDALGFLSTADEVIPGNYGLWDMIRALEWVRDVISSFNGDENNVTVFGESSGSTSVSLLVLTQSARGLFRRAVMESGVSVTSWAAASDPTVWPAPRTQAEQLAGRLGCALTDSTRLLTCLRTKSATDIIAAATNMSQEVGGDILFKPVIEATFGQTGLFTATPQSLLEQGSFNNVTAIRGYNMYESSVSDPEDDGLTLEEFKSGLHDLTRWYIVLHSPLSSDVIESLLLDAYVTGQNVTDPVKLREAYLQLKTDYGFVASTIQEVNLTSQRTVLPQYLYRFSYRSSHRQAPVWQGAQHADELHYVFGSPITNDFMWNGFVTTWTDDDKRVSDDVMTLWTNFAKYGNPTPEDNDDVNWLPWTRNSPNYLDIGVTDRALSGVRTKQISVWTDVIFSHTNTAGEGPPVG